MMQGGRAELRSTVAGSQRAATHRAPHFGQTYVVMLPIACSMTPSAPHFGHLFVGFVGAGTWMGIGSNVTAAARRDEGRLARRTGTGAATSLAPR